jgi:hypothetical protein
VRYAGSRWLAAAAFVAGGAEMSLPLWTLLLNVSDRYKMMFNDIRATDPTHEGRRACPVDVGVGYDGRIVAADDACAH